MKYAYKIFESIVPEIDACKFLNNHHISPERIISLTPIEYYKNSGYIGDKVRKVVLFYLEE